MLFRSVIFNDGGSQQYPGSRQPGLDYNGGIVKWYCHDTSEPWNEAIPRALMVRPQRVTPLMNGSPFSVVWR